MSKPSCDACSNLREYNANFIMNGVTDDIAASLANNTGLNACLTDLHTDCEDLNDVNDCLIGHMDDDVDNYEVCDWKSLMHNFFPNLYETLKAMIAAICGLWTKSSEIEKRISETETAFCTSQTFTAIQLTNDSGINGDNNTHAYIYFKKITMPTQCGGCTLYEVWPEIHADESEKIRDTYDSSIKDAADRVPMGHINKADAVPKYFSEKVWNVLTAYQIGSGITVSGGLHGLESCGDGLLFLSATGPLADDGNSFETDALYVFSDQTIAGASSGDILRSSLSTGSIYITECD